MHLKYCEICKHFLPFSEQTCPICQNLAGNNSQRNFYLSGDITLEQDKLFSHGEVLEDRFKIISNIGNSASVYAAVDLLRNIRVCIKILLQGPKNKITEWIQENREFHTFLNIDNFQHIVRIYDIHDINHSGTNFLFQSMEYGASGTFQDFLNILINDPIGRLTTGLGYFIQACQGIKVLHDHGIVHLDIRPENFLLIDGGLKAIDIGLFQYCLSSHAKNKTRTMEIIHKISSPEYTSPEVLRATQFHEIDNRSDVYSLGILLYKLVHPSCLLPYSGLAENIHESQFRSTVPGLVDIKPEFAEVIEVCLKQHPEDRFENVSLLITALKDIDFQVERGPYSSEAECSEAECQVCNKHGQSNKDDESETILEKAKLLYNQDKLYESEQLLNNIQQNSSHLQAANLLKKQISDRYTQTEKIYSKIQHQYEKGNLSTLVEMMREACTIYPGHPKAVYIETKIHSMAKLYCEAMEAGQRHLEREQWADALSALRQALMLEKNDICIVRTVEVLEKIMDLRTNIDLAIQCDDFNKAIALSCLVDEQKEYFYGH